MNARPVPATIESEKFLRAELEYNRNHDIYPDHNRVIERMLDHREVLRPFYDELNKKLPSSERRQVVLEVIVDVGAVANPGKTRLFRDEKRHAKDLNDKIRDIAKQLQGLGTLLREREADCPSVDALLLPSVGDLLEAATRKSQDRCKPWMFASKLAPKLEDLSGQFDSKYWPTCEELIAALADAVMTATDPESAPDLHCPVLAEAVRPRSHSDADFSRALEEALQDRQRLGNYRGFESLPPDFRLSEKALDCLHAVILGHEWQPDTVKKRRTRRSSRDSSRKNRG